MKAEEEKMVAQDAEQQRRHETPSTGEHYFTKQEEANRRAREADARGMTSKTWPPPQSPAGNFPSCYFQNLINCCNSCLKGLTSAFFYLFPTVLSIDDNDINSIDGFDKGAPGLHPKPEGEEPECYCYDVCKMKVSGDYKTL
jgi:hypothetical protein